MGVGGGVEELPDLCIAHSRDLGYILQGDFRSCPSAGHLSAKGYQSRNLSSHRLTQMFHESMSRDCEDGRAPGLTVLNI
jgi:hypothetical protein